MRKIASYAIPAYGFTLLNNAISVYLAADLTPSRAAGALTLLALLISLALFYDQFLRSVARPAVPLVFVGLGDGGCGRARGARPFRPGPGNTGPNLNGVWNVTEVVHGGADDGKTTSFSIPLRRVKRFISRGEIRLIN